MRVKCVRVRSVRVRSVRAKSVRTKSVRASKKRPRTFITKVRICAIHWVTLVDSTEKFHLYFRLSHNFDVYSESLKKCPILKRPARSSSSQLLRRSLKPAMVSQPGGLPSLTFQWWKSVSKAFLRNCQQRGMRRSLYMPLKIETCQGSRPSRAATQNTNLSSSFAWLGDGRRNFGQPVTKSCPEWIFFGLLIIVF